MGHPVLVIARSEATKQSRTASRFSQAALDCFAEPVIGPRDFARVRWLAMTNSSVPTPRFFEFAPRVEKPGPRFPTVRSVVCFPSPLNSKGRENERKQNADRRVVYLLHLAGAARTLAGARSPVGVPLRLSPGRQLVPKAQRQAMLSGTVRSVRSATAAPTGGRRSCASPRVLPAPEKRTLSQSSEHLTRRS